MNEITAILPVVWYKVLLKSECVPPPLFLASYKRDFYNETNCLIYRVSVNWFPVNWSKCVQVLKCNYAGDTVLYLWGHYIILGLWGLSQGQDQRDTYSTLNHIILKKYT